MPCACGNSVALPSAGSRNHEAGAAGAENPASRCVGPMNAKRETVRPQGAGGGGGGGRRVRCVGAGWAHHLGTPEGHPSWLLPWCLTASAHQPASAQTPW